MSLYNALFGENPLSGLLLSALGILKRDVPRYRDVFLVEEEGKLRIMIHTRTGGGNRAFYDSQESCRANYPNDFDDEDADHPAGPWNDDLRALPTFVRDEDSKDDATYANFFFDVPLAFSSMIALLHEMTKGKIERPETRWTKLFEDLKAGAHTPDGKRALEVGAEVMKRLDETPDGGTVTV